MVSFILPGNSATGGYEVANSCRFNSGSSDRLTKTFSGSGTNNKIMTFSFWCKKTIQSGWSYIIHNGQSDGDPVCVIGFEDNYLKFNYYVGGSTLGRLKTNRLFRDVSAWYHIVVSIDTTQSTSSNRIKFYVNGVQETSFSQSDYPSQNQTITLLQGTDVHTIGASAVPDGYFSGYITELVVIDGQQLAADQFGEFDEDSPTIWKPIDVSGLTFGTNGFYLDFEDSSALGNDVSGNNNDFTVNNLTAIDQSTDTCTNNFATLNSVAQWDLGGSSVYSEGNLKCVLSSNFGKATSTIGVTQGKWYMEVKQTAENKPLGNGESVINVIGDPIYTTSNWNGYAQTFGLRNHNGYEYTGTAEATSQHSNWTAGDIIGVALDMDNLRVYFSKNGQWYDGSGNWDESSPNAYISLSSSYSTYFLCLTLSHDSATETFEVNFGSPSFSISSGNSDANVYCNFEYSVPSVYYALNSKNLAEFG